MRQTLAATMRQIVMLAFGFLLQTAAGPSARAGDTHVAQSEPGLESSPARVQAQSARGLLLRFAAARSWGYQLQGIDLDRLEDAPYDVLVLDITRDGSSDDLLTVRDIERLKKRPDGKPRIILAYLSIGEAETYRDYWKWYWGGHWATHWMRWLYGPPWLGPANKDWGGNYAVRYWEPRWQQIILGTGHNNGYLDRILAAGFDGVVLDKVDSSVEAIARTRATAQDDMRRFVERIAAKGRAARPGFLIVPQNGEELLDDPRYRTMIDGLVKEDLLYGGYTEKQPNPPDEIAQRIEQLKMLTASGKPVLAVEYLDHAAHIEGAKRRLTALGFVPHFADRALDQMRFGDLPGSGPAQTNRRRWPR